MSAVSNISLTIVQGSNYVVYWRFILTFNALAMRRLLSTYCPFKRKIKSYCSNLDGLVSKCYGIYNILSLTVLTRRATYHALSHGCYQHIICRNVFAVCSHMIRVNYLPYTVSTVILPKSLILPNCTIKMYLHIIPTKKDP